MHHGRGVRAGGQRRRVDRQFGGQRDRRLTRVQIPVEIGQRDVLRRGVQQAVLGRPPCPHQEAGVADPQAHVPERGLHEPFHGEHPAG
jgi:hypothetical protein